MTETDGNSTTSASDPAAAAIPDRVYLPAERWRALLHGLQAANGAPPDQAMALRTVIEFLDAAPPVSESGITRPLHQLLAALPDLLRLVSCWNTLAAELSAPSGADETMPEIACTQLQALLKFTNSVAGEPITALLTPVVELAAEVVHEAQRLRAEAEGGS
jgi:hypothetical protein